MLLLAPLPCKYISWKSYHILLPFLLLKNEEVPKVSTSCSGLKYTTFMVKKMNKSKLLGYFPFYMLKMFEFPMFYHYCSSNIKLVSTATNTSLLKLYWIRLLPLILLGSFVVDHHSHGEKLEKSIKVLKSFLKASNISSDYLNLRSQNPIEGKKNKKMS